MKIGRTANQEARLFIDTDPDVEQFLIEQMRRLSPARKMQMLGELTANMRVFAFAGLRSRHPTDDEAMLRRRYADLLLGPTLAAQVLGPLPEHDPGGPSQVQRGAYAK